MFDNYLNNRTPQLLIFFIMLILHINIIDVFCSEQKITFDEVSKIAGVRISTQTWGNPTWVDFDNDGLLDVFVVNHKSQPSLFHNNGDGTFTNVTSIAGFTEKADRHGASWGDYDNDGNLDLFITIGANRGMKVGMKTDQLYRNNGDGTFTDITDISKVENKEGRGRSVNWVDFDGDGYLDIFIKNYATKNRLYRNNGNGTFTDLAMPLGIADAPGGVSTWIDYDKDGDMDLFIILGTTDQLWRNNSNGTFTEISSQAGIKTTSYGQGVAWGDYNNDGYMDLFISRGYNDVERSTSWDSSLIAFSDQESQGESGFDFVTSGDHVTFDLYIEKCRKSELVHIGESGSSPTSIPFTVSSGKALGKPLYTPGLDKGIFIWQNNNTWHIRWSSDETIIYYYGKVTSSGNFLSVKPVGFKSKQFVEKSTIYRNKGDGTFTDVTDVAGLGNIKNNRGAAWGDFDNDGNLDLYVVNSGSFQRNAANTLYRNKGDETFEDVTGTAAVWGSVDGRGDGAAWGDFDNDGFLDLYVVNGWGHPIIARQGDRACLVYGPHLLYKNPGNGNGWLKVTLVGTRSNRNGIGAKLLLRAGNLKQYREVNGGGGGEFFSQGHGPVHFGLHRAEIVDSLTVQWPSGLVQTMTSIAPSQHLTIVEEE